MAELSEKVQHDPVAGGDGVDGTSGAEGADDTGTGKAAGDDTGDGARRGGKGKGKGRGKNRQPKPKPEIVRRERVVDAPLAEPAATQGLLEVFRRRYLLKLLVRREIQARYSGSFLGLIWSYINPASQFAIYYFLHIVLMARGNKVENFAVHVFCGLVVVHFFTETFHAGTRSIVQNKALIKKMALPKEMFPVASMLVSLYHVAPQLLILGTIIFFQGWSPDPVVPIALLLALGIIMCLSTALALVFSVANVYFRDFSSVVNILTNFVRFSVPMIYPYSIIAERFGSASHYYLLNPLADAVLLVQRGIWVGATENPAYVARTELPPHLLADGVVSLIGSAILLVVAQLIFRRFESRIPERLTA